MKIILREKKLQEAALKASQTIVSRVFTDLVTAYNSGMQNGLTYVQVPIEDLIASSNKPLVIGAILYYTKVILGDNIKDNQNLIQVWDPDKKDFNPAFKQKMLKEKFPVDYGWDVRLPSNADGLATVFNHNGYSAPVILISLIVRKDIKEKLPVIRHETQHYTQLFSDICLYYYELLKRGKFDFTQMQEPSLIVKSEQAADFDPTKGLGIRKTTGLGKFKLGSLPQIPIPNRADYATDKEYEAALEIALERYFQDDAEFESWTSDFAEQYVKYLTRTNQLGTKQAVIAYFLQKYPMLATPTGSLNESETRKRMEALNKLAKELGVTPERARKMVRNSDSLNRIVSSLVRALFADKRVLEDFADFTNVPAFEKAAIYLAKARPKEFQRDLIMKVTEELTKLIENNFPFVKNL
jgi:hypothetical protein